MPEFTTYSLSWLERIDSGFMPRFTQPKCQKHSVILGPNARAQRWQIAQIDHREIIFKTAQDESYRFVITAKPPILEQIAAIPPSSYPCLMKPENLRVEISPTECSVFYSSTPIGKISVSGPPTYAFNERWLVISDTKNVSLYGIDSQCLKLIWNKPIANFCVLGVAGEKILGTIEKTETVFQGPKVVTSTRNELHILNLQGSSLFQVSNCNPKLSRLVGPAFVVINQASLSIVDLESGCKRIFSTQFESPISHYCINNMQLACMLESGNLCYWQITKD